MLAQNKLFRPRLVLVMWCLTTLLSFALLSAPHAGVFFYYLFIVIGWPFYYYDQHRTILVFCLSALVQLSFVGILQVIAAWLVRAAKRG